MPTGLKIVGWAVSIVAVVLFVVMQVVTLPRLASMAGEPIFDVRTGGYDFATAQRIVGKLGVDGASYFETVQHRIDEIFLVLFCFALVYWLIVGARRWQGYGLALSGPVLAAILAVPVIAGIADLGENAAVSVMLSAGAPGVTPAMANAADLFTLAKFFFDAVALLLCIALFAGPSVVRHLGRRRP